MKSGTTMAAAVAAAGVTLPPPQQAAARQMDVARAGQQAPAPLVMLFEMRKGETKIIPSDRGDAWLIVHLDTIEPGNAQAQPALVDATRTQFADILGQDFAQQFVAAAARELGVKRYPQAVAKLKARLSGTATDQ
jgi:peptidyl-prolyl cis-trans isomerase D